MSFQPIVPGTGYAGWRFFDRTVTVQKEAFVANATNQGDANYVRDRLATVRSSDDLVNDHRLLSVALSAFGLEDDIGSKAFVKRLLDDGSFDPDGLANQLTNRQYLKFVEAMEPLLLLGGDRVGEEFANDLINRFETRSFEKAVGTQNESYRLALNIERELQELSAENTTIDAKWFSVMGSPPVRHVFEKALSLPITIGKLDIDQQLGIFKERSEKFLGTKDIADFADKEAREKLVQRFLLMDQIGSIQTLSSNQLALQLLHANNS